MEGQDSDNRRPSLHSRRVSVKRSLLILVLSVLLGLFGSIALAGASIWGIPHHRNSVPTVVATIRPTPPPPPPAPTTTRTPLPASPAPITPFPAGLQQEIAVLQAHHRLLFHGMPTRREVALTFDDGPNPFYTPAVLAILKRYRVHATFFCLGTLVALYPQLVQQEHAAGHVVGDHSWSHPQLPLLTPSQILWQMRATADTIQQVIKVRPTFFRPPYGDYDSQVLTQANRLGLTTVLWNDDPRDWSWPGTTGIIYWVLTQASMGSIILLHDGGGNRWQTVAALPTLIESLQREGFTLVTLQQMVDEMHGTLSRPRPPLIKPPRGISLISSALLLALAWRCEAWALRRRCWLAARRLRVR